MKKLTIYIEEETVTDNRTYEKQADQIKWRAVDRGIMPGTDDHNIHSMYVYVTDGVRIMIGQWWPHREEWVISRDGNSFLERNKMTPTHWAFIKYPYESLTQLR